MSSPQTKVAPNSAEAMSAAMPTEAAAVPKQQVLEADLNVVACNGDASVSIDGAEAKPSDGDENRSEAEGEGGDYNVGDLVWAKIKSHPWWPGQIHDPKDASESAGKPGQEGRLLVAFFGDGSFSWCLPSQIAPLVENFSRLSKDGASRSFVNAVNKALDEVSRVLDSYMTCSCVSSEARDDVLSRPAVENAGIKAGVLFPEVDADRLSLPNYEASDVFSRLAGFAKNVPSDGILDLGVVRGWLSAFHRSKGLGKLKEYHEPFYIEGLEDNSSDEGISDDISIPISAPLGPQEDDDDDGPSSPNSVGKPRRRRKSVNDIMAESVSLSPKRRKRTPVRYVEMPISGTMKKSAVIDKDVAGSSGKKKEKEKVKDSSESPKTADEEVGSSVARSGDGNSKQKTKAMEDVNTKDNTTELGAGSSGEKKNGKGKAKDSESPGNADEAGSKRKPEAIEAVDAEEGDVVMSTPRERKKSKYLSNPYVEPIGRVGSSSFKKILEASKEVKTDGEGGHTVITPKPAQDRPVDEVKEGTSDRDADLDITLSSLKSKVDSPGKKAKSQELENLKAVAKKATKGKADSSERSKSKKSAESSQADDNPSPSLVIAFTSAFPLPSKDDILKVYSKFGRLNEQETNVFVYSHSAQVAFDNIDDAEKAFKSSASKRAFGAESVVTQWLRYGPGARGLLHVPEGSDKAAAAVDDALSEMNLIKNKLAITDAVLRAYHEKFKEADKESLKVDLRNLAERVEAVRERVNELAQGTTMLSEKRGG